MTATQLQPLEWQGLRLRLARTAWISTALAAAAPLLAAIPNDIRLTGVFTQQEQYVAGLAGAPAPFSPTAPFEFCNNLAYNALWAAAVTVVVAAFVRQPLRAQVQRGVDNLTRPRASVQPETQLKRAQPAKANPPAPAPVSPARVSLADYAFRLLAVAGVLAWAALAASVLAHPGAPGLAGQGLVLRVWLGVCVGPVVLLLGGLVLWRLPGNACGRILILVAWAAIVMQFSVDPGAPPAALLGADAALLFTCGLVGPALGHLMLTFPSGRIFPARWASGVRVAAGLKFAGVLLEMMATPGKIRIFTVPTNLLFVPALAPYRPVIMPTIGITGVLLPLITLAGMVSLVQRYRSGAALERQQIKWVMWGFGVFAPAAMAAVALIFGFGPDSAQFRGGFVVVAIAQTLFLASIAFAIMRFRLFDIDLLINRTLVYGTLSVLVVGVYVLAVGTISQLIQTSGSFFLSLLATGLIALLFQPVRERLQRGVNRLLYGERDDPYAVLSNLAKRLEGALAPQAVLPALVETIAQALKLPYVAVALQPASAEEPQIAAVYGLPSPAVWHLPLTYQSECIGELLITPRGPGKGFTPAEKRLLSDIAHQAGAAAHTVRLTADLQRSRERLVTTREEERRRLRRDLHDGLGPALAIQSLKVGSARTLLGRNLPAPAAGTAPGDLQRADELLSELERDIAATLADIRSLVYDLRPPTLDELGLVAAIRESAARYAPGPDNNPQALRVRVEAPERLPAMPAAVEVAAFRITQEAFNNVVRHARARNCLIRLKIEDGLWVEIVDDGVGLPTIRDPERAGVGLASLRERAAELGGTCSIECPVGGGTRILAHIPWN